MAVTANKNSLISQLLLRERVSSILHDLILEDKRAMLINMKVSTDIIDKAEAIIKEIPWHVNEIDNVIELYLDWVAKNIIEKNEKNKEKNIAMHAKGYPPTLVEYKDDKVLAERIIVVLLWAYKNKKDLKLLVKLENLEEEYRQHKAEAAEMVKEIERRRASEKTKLEHPENFHWIPLKSKCQTHGDKVKSFASDFSDETIVFKFNDGDKFVKLDTPDKIYREGHIQNLCLKDHNDGNSMPAYGKSYADSVNAGTTSIFSLRTSKNVPICTIELKTGEIKRAQNYTKNNEPATPAMEAAWNRFMQVYLKEKTDNYLKIFAEKKFKSPNEVRVYLAMMTGLPEALYRELENDGNSDVLVNLISNNDVPEDVRKRLYNKKELKAQKIQFARVADDPMMLVEFSHDEDIKVREEVAGNKNTPAEILYELAQNDDYPVIYKLSSNANVPNRAFDVMISRFGAEHPDMLANIANQPHVNANIIRKLLREGPDSLHKALAKHVNAPGDVLTELSKSKDTEVRSHVARNNNTRIEVLLEMYKVAVGESNAGLTDDTVAGNQTFASNYKAMAELIPTMPPFVMTLMAGASKNEYVLDMIVKHMMADKEKTEYGIQGFVLENPSVSTETVQFILAHEVNKTIKQNALRILQERGVTK